jgi:hypothetical protein
MGGPKILYEREAVQGRETDTSNDRQGDMTTHTGDRGWSGRFRRKEVGLSHNFEDEMVNWASREPVKWNGWRNCLKGC